MPRTISSLQNPRVKAALRLRDRRGRIKQERMIIDGQREIARAVAAGILVKELYISPSSRPPPADLVQTIQDAGGQIFEVTSAVFDKLAFGQRSEGLIAVAATPTNRLDQLSLPAVPLIAVLVGLEKPGNVGAVMRSADAAGVSGVIVADKGTDLYNPNTIRASLGTIFDVQVCTATSDETVEWLRERGITVMAARVDAAEDFFATDLTGPLALVLGSEATGLAATWSQPDIRPVALPLVGTADSLNVSATAAVMFYEALRQRRHHG